MSDAGDDDNIIKVSGTERQVHAFPLELPTGAQVVGMAVVYVRLNGDVSVVLRCHGTDRRNRQAFHDVVAMALGNFRQKHGLHEAGESDVKVRRS